MQFAPVATIAAGAIGFGLADVAGGSGFLAVYIVGLWVGNTATPLRRYLVTLPCRPRVPRAGRAVHRPRALRVPAPSRPGDPAGPRPRRRPAARRASGGRLDLDDVPGLHRSRPHVPRLGRPARRRSDRARDVPAGRRAAAEPDDLQRRLLRRPCVGAHPGPDARAARARAAPHRPARLATSRRSRSRRSTASAAACSSSASPRTHALVGTHVRELGLPRDSLVAVIVRDGEAVPPRGSTQIERRRPPVRALAQGEPPRRSNGSSTRGGPDLRGSGRSARFLELRGGAQARHCALRRSRRLDGARRLERSGGRPPARDAVLRARRRSDRAARRHGREVRRRRRDGRVRRAAARTRTTPSAPCARRSPSSTPVRELGLEARIGVEAGEVVVEDARLDVRDRRGRQPRRAPPAGRRGPARSCSGPARGGSPPARSRSRTRARSRSRAAASRSGRGARSRVLDAPRGVAAARVRRPRAGARAAREHATTAPSATAARTSSPSSASPGVGKSRLVAEFAAGAERVDRPRPAARCRTARASRYWPLASMIKASAGITDDDPAAEAFEKLRALLRERGRRRPARGRARRARRGRGRAHAPAS